MKAENCTIISFGSMQKSNNGHEIFAPDPDSNLFPLANRASCFFPEGNMGCPIRSKGISGSGSY